jgi:hypothetical protein
VRWFLVEAFSRIVSPVPAGSGANHFAARGLTYKVVSREGGRGHTSARLEGAASSSLGLTVEEESHVDLETGFVIEGTRTASRDTELGTRRRVGVLTWSVKRTAP